MTVNPRRRILPAGAPRRAPAYDGPTPPAAASGYVAHAEVRDVALAAARYRRWADDAPLDDILGGDPHVPAVVGTTVLRGRWNAPGARRRIALADGHYAAEEVVANEELPDGSHLFRYVVFGYTSSVRAVLDHAVGEFRTVPLQEAVSRVEWTYRFHPRSALVRPAVARFVRRVWAPYMATVLTAMTERAAREA